MLIILLVVSVMSAKAERIVSSSMRNSAGSAQQEMLDVIKKCGVKNFVLCLKVSDMNFHLCRELITVCSVLGTVWGHRPLYHNLRGL